MKKVSVLIPLYNKENFILETIFSVDRQITKDAFKIEVIIVNDCSTDRSLEVVKDYIWKNENVEVKIIENEVNLGPSASLNKALEVLSGDYVALLDADDVLTRYSLHSRFNALEKGNEYDWLSGLELRMEANGNIIVGREFVKYNPPVEQKEIINGLLTGELFLPTSSLFFKSKIFKNIKWIDSMRSSPEFALCIMVALAQFKLLLIEEYVAIYRYHQEGSSESLYQITKSNGQKVKDFTTLKLYLESKLTKDQNKYLDVWINKWKQEQLDK